MSTDHKPAASEPISQIRQYRLTYSDPGIEEAFLTYADAKNWRIQRNALINAGYDVTAETREDSNSEWTPAVDAA